MYPGIKKKVIRANGLSQEILVKLMMSVANKKRKS